MYRVRVLLRRMRVGGDSGSRYLAEVGYDLGFFFLKPGFSNSVSHRCVYSIRMAGEHRCGSTRTIWHDVFKSVWFHCFQSKRLTGTTHPLLFLTNFVPNECGNLMKSCLCTRACWLLYIYVYVCVFMCTYFCVCLFVKYN